MVTYVITPALAFHSLRIPAVEVSAMQLNLILLYGRAALLVFSFLLATWAFTRWRHATIRESARTTELSLAVLEKLSHIATELTGIQSAIGAIDARVTSLASRQEDNVHMTGTGGAAGYPIAIRMARGGASREEIVAVTGLTQQETDLVIRLHARTGRTQDIAA